MSNSINWGKIYENTYWGNGVTDNTINWGQSYKDLAQSYVGLLNEYGGASAAYSLRLLDNTYTGSAIRVRRSSDNAEQDIGFVDNELDTASLLSFVGGGFGYVTTWYDQSGNGNNATQTTASAQPQIVSSGALILSGTKPCMQTTTYTFFNTPAIALAHSIFTSIDRSANICVMDGVGGGDPQIMRFIGATTQFIERYSSVNGYFNSVLSFDETTLGSDVYGNTGKLLISSVGNPNIINTRRIFTRNSIGQKFQELITYPNDQSANRVGIETNINNYYNVYYDPNNSDFDDDYKAVLNYAIAQGYTLPSRSQQFLQNDLVISLKADGIWNKLDSLGIWATENAEFALIDWKRLTKMTAVNSPTFTADVGYTGDLTSAYIDLGFSPSTSGNYALSDASVGVWYGNTNTRRSSFNYLGFGTESTTTNRVWLSPIELGFVVYGLNSGAVGTSDTSINTKFMTITRNNSTTFDYYLNGSFGKTISRTEALSLNSNNFYALAVNENGTPLGFSDDQIRMLYVGQHLTGTEISNFYTAINTYMSAL